MRASRDLRTIRSTKGMSLRELARRTNITAAHLSLVELGQRGVSVEVVERLANELDEVRV